MHDSNYHYHILPFAHYVLYSSLWTYTWVVHLHPTCSLQPNTPFHSCHWSSLHCSVYSCPHPHILPHTTCSLPATCHTACPHHILPHTHTPPATHTTRTPLHLPCVWEASTAACYLTAARGARRLICGKCSTYREAAASWRGKRAACA